MVNQLWKTVCILSTLKCNKLRDAVHQTRIVGRMFTPPVTGNQHLFIDVHQSREKHLHRDSSVKLKVHFKTGFATIRHVNDQRNASIKAQFIASAEYYTSKFKESGSDYSLLTRIANQLMQDSINVVD